MKARGAYSVHWHIDGIISFDEQTARGGVRSKRCGLEHKPAAADRHRGLLALHEERSVRACRLHDRF